ncbi:hypothetical protein PPTG_04770 [Phytophthora nicotianae INRA-310]|uniref:Myb/SANT-like domain-containing protein n=1 Tax=Phytophthora nicotianae (strain INRA-310) TaxID=761204 RepID=W2R1Z7_PHYN3|nr:hypothetical protein PPTG_04770 [Phytophthora nicotianae INRA-310]ETN19462.1 hypothetical protein PPTG_04770 [Phytophthora nicotianae INRA-310]
MVWFTDELDFQLIQEAQTRNPFGEDYGKKTQAWADVAAMLGVGVDGHRCHYTPKDECLADWLEMREMEMLLKNDKKQQKDQPQQEDGQAIAIRDAATTGMKRGQRKGGESYHHQQQQLLAYLEQRDGVAHEMDKRKISNEKKRLALKQCRLELQELRMKLERNERLAFIDMLKTVISKYNS